MPKIEPDKIGRQILKNVPLYFESDGCSSAPDHILFYDIRWCCLIHDWRYCTRCHPAGSMSRGAQSWADTELGLNIRRALPFGLRWVGWIYYRVTNTLGGMRAWDSCGPNAGLMCRHGMEVPTWMASLLD